MRNLHGRLKVLERRTAEIEDARDDEWLNRTLPQIPRDDLIALVALEEQGLAVQRAAFYAVLRKHGIPIER